MGRRVPDKPWKAAEREVADLIGGRRAWANSGETVDCIGPVFLAQVKLNKPANLSGPEVERLAESIGALAAEQGKLGIVAVKLRRPANQTTGAAPWIISMTGATFAELVRRIAGP